MSDCPRGEIRDRLPDLLHDTLSGPARLGLEQHVAACAACAREFELLCEARDAMASVPAVDVEAVVAAVRARRTPELPRGRGAPAHPVLRFAGRRRGQLWRIAAAVVLTVGAAAVYATAARRDAPLAVARAGRASRLDTSVGRRGAAPLPGVASTAVALPAAESASRTVPPAHGTSPAETRVGLFAAGGIGDLADGDIATLMHALDGLSAVPDAEPAPVLPAVTEEGV